MVKTVRDAYQIADNDVRPRLAQRVLEGFASYVPPFCTSKTFRDLVGGNLVSPQTSLDKNNDLFAAASRDAVNDFRQGISNAFMSHIDGKGMIIPADNPPKLWIFSANSGVKSSKEGSLGHSLSTCLEKFLESAGLTRDNLWPVLQTLMFRFVNYGRVSFSATIQDDGDTESRKIGVSLGGVTDRENIFPYISAACMLENPDTFPKVNAVSTLKGPYKIVLQALKGGQPLDVAIRDYKNHSGFVNKDEEEYLKEKSFATYERMRDDLAQINKTENALSEWITALGFGLDQIMNNVLLIPVSQLSEEERAKSSLILQSSEEKEAFLAGKTGVLEAQLTNLAHSQSSGLITKGPQPFEMPWGIADLAGNTWEASEIKWDSLTIGTLTCNFAHNDRFSVYLATCSGHNLVGKEFSPGDVILCIKKFDGDLIIPVARKDALHLFPDLPSIGNDARPPNLSVSDLSCKPDK